jgi:ABC-2 type transport system ATP-binding protein
VPVTGPRLAADAVRELDRIEAGIAGIEIRTPTLDDVFFTLTGRHVQAKSEHPEEVAP